MRILLLLTFASLIAAPLAAQRPGGFPRGPAAIQASGEGVVRVKPDQARISIGVVTQGKTAEQAAQANARQTDAALAELKSRLGEEARYETRNYRIWPERRDSRSDAGPQIVGFSASNLIEVTLSDVSRVGEALDAAVAAGANQVQNIQFGLTDDAAARSEALAAAAKKAREEVQTLADALGVTTSRILSVTEGDSSAAQPYQTARAMQLEAASTPVEAGEVEVRATVTVTAEISQ